VNISLKNKGGEIKVNSQVRKNVLSIIVLVGLLSPLVTVLAYDVSGRVTSFETEKWEGPLFIGI